MSELTVRSGRLIRPGFYRAPDGSGANYAKQLRESGDECIFCPESLDARGIEILETVGSAACKFFVFNAAPAYAHYEAQKVLNHRLIVPEVHVEGRRELKGLLGRAALEDLDDYIFAQEEANDEETFFQDLTRTETNPSKSVGHLHTHLLTLSLQPVSKFKFNIHRGVTELEFAELTPEQIDEVVRSRRSTNLMPR